MSLLGKYYRAVELQELHDLKCPLCGMKLKHKGGIGHSCVFDNHTENTRTEIFQCSVCNLRITAPLRRG